MPRDSSDTRDDLVRAAERLFADHGVFEATVRDITKLAGQRNPSVIHYHFGSVGGLRVFILKKHGEPMDIERGKRAARLGDHPTTRHFVDCLVVPYGNALLTESGRDYVRIVAQFSGQFHQWQSGGDVTAPHLQAALTAIRDGQTHLAPAVRENRIYGTLALMTGVVAGRAIVLHKGGKPKMSHKAFLDDLTTMITACVEAPPGTV